MRLTYRQWLLALGVSLACYWRPCEEEDLILTLVNYNFFKLEDRSNLGKGNHKGNEANIISDGKESAEV